LSKQRAKGTAFESLVVAYLKEVWPAVERRALSGNLDKGDIAGIPGVVLECKNHQSLSLPAWLAEAEVERVNADADYGFVVAKRRGKGKAEEQYVVMTLADLVGLLQQAGY